MSERKFLVVADDSPEFETALRFACRRARSTRGHVALLKVIEPAVFEHWSGVREEIERQARQEAESERTALKSVVAEDPDIKILVLAASTGNRGPGPLIASIAKEGVNWGARKIPVTVVPGDLTDEEIADLA
jgi:nucleotide-binding universal stress UspA family protein